MTKIKVEDLVRNDGRKERERENANLRKGQTNLIKPFRS